MTPGMVRSSSFRTAQDLRNHRLTLKSPPKITLKSPYLPAVVPGNATSEAIRTLSRIKLSTPDPSGIAILCIPSEIDLHRVDGKFYRWLCSTLCVSASTRTFERIAALFLGALGIGRAKRPLAVPGLFASAHKERHEETSSLSAEGKIPGLQNV